MQEIHKTTLLDRCRRAYEAFRGKPISSLHMGIDIKRCDQCERAEVIHCAECVHYRKSETAALYCERLYSTMGVSPAILREPYDYCSKAVRK